MLICSLMYQESSFKPDAVSWSGAQGLMQLMPPTAREVGVKDPFDPAESIRGGTYYLKKQYRRVPDEVDTINRTCFALASYNGGYGHLIDARKLAEKKVGIQIFGQTTLTMPMPFSLNPTMQNAQNMAIAAARKSSVTYVKS